MLAIRRNAAGSSFLATARLVLSLTMRSPSKGSVLPATSFGRAARLLGRELPAAIDGHPARPRRLRVVVGAVAQEPGKRRDGDPAPVVDVCGRGVDEPLGLAPIEGGQRPLDVGLRAGSGGI